MSELSPETREFLARERHSDAPTSADRKRIRERLMLELGAAAFTAGAGAGAVQQIAQQTEAMRSAASSSAPVAAKAGLTGAASAKLSLAAKLVLSSVLFGGAATLLWPRAAPLAASVPASAPAPAELPPPDLEPEDAPAPAVAEAAEPAAAPQRRRSPKARALEAPSSLTEELSLLSSAQGALRAGKPSESLRIASEHAARFPRGSMRDERLGIEALARCALGEPGDKAAAQFLRETSGSPLAPAVRKACNLP